MGGEGNAPTEANGASLACMSGLGGFACARLPPSPYFIQCFSRPDGCRRPQLPWQLLLSVLPHHFPFSELQAQFFFPVFSDN